MEKEKRQRKIRREVGKADPVNRVRIKEGNRITNNERK